MQPAVRPSRDGDLVAIQAIYAHHVLHGLGSFEEIPPDVAEIARRRADVLGLRPPYLVPELDRRILVSAYAGLHRPRPTSQPTVDNSLYFHDDLERVP